METCGKISIRLSQAQTTASFRLPWSRVVQFGQVKSSSECILLLERLNRSLGPERPFVEVEEL